jgi:hypothetical protein
LSYPFSCNQREISGRRRKPRSAATIADITWQSWEAQFRLPSGAAVRSAIKRRGKIEELPLNQPGVSRRITFWLTDPAPVMPDIQLRRDFGIRCSQFVQRVAQFRSPPSKVSPVMTAAANHMPVTKHIARIIEPLRLRKRSGIAKTCADKTLAQPTITTMPPYRGRMKSMDMTHINGK